jgi:transposase-like protein
MMNQHANAKLGLAGRHELVLAIEGAMTLKRAAACFSVSPATAHRWWHRWIEGGRASTALRDRSSRPHRQPRRLAPAEEEPILRARRETNLGPGRLAGIVRRARSTIWKVLHRHGLSRRPRGQRQSYRRYEWSRPGALLHMDVKKLARFSVPGHRVTGDPTTKDLHRGIGYDHLHCLVDDHSRVAYVELHPREDADTNACTLERALRFFAELGLDPPEAVMTDKAMVYRNSRRFQQLLAQTGARHIRTPAIHAAVERQSRAIHPNAAKRMGLQPHLARLERARPLPPKLHPLLQPAAAAQLTRRPPTDQPRSQPPWAGQLEG